MASGQLNRFKPLFAIVDQSGQLRPQILAMDDPVDEAVFHQKFARLKADGQFEADGVLDGAGSGKANHRFGFGDGQVALQGPTGGDTPMVGCVSTQM